MNLIRCAIYFYEYGLISLGNVAYSLADESDKAVTAKATARNMFADTVSFVRHLLKKGECYYNLFNNNDMTKALEVANECVYVSKSSVDCCQAWLLVAKVQSICMSDMVALGESYGQAVCAIGQDGSGVSSVEYYMLPLHDLLSYAKLLITTGGSKYNDALKVLLAEVNIRYTSASLFLYIGICCLRLNRLPDAEDALQEANLLENRNPDIWAYLSLFILTTGSMYRIGEAEQALAQAIRLGLNNSNLIRELAISYMAVDKLVVAEDLIRRALAIETGTASGGVASGRGNSRTRKLMADILAAQNQAAKAIDEYQDILSDDIVELNIRLSAGERCVVLLASLGRDEEVKQLSNILSTLRNANNVNAIEN